MLDLDSTADGRVPKTFGQEYESHQRNRAQLSQDRLLHWLKPGRRLWGWAPDLIDSYSLTYKTSVKKLRLVACGDNFDRLIAW